MTDLRELLRPRVERGAALLDSVEPYWWKRIEEQLSLADCTRCVLGQVFGHYTLGLDEVAAVTGAYVGNGGEFGFAAAESDRGDLWDRYWATLDDLWLEAIAERRAA